MDMLDILDTPKMLDVCFYKLVLYSTRHIKPRPMLSTTYRFKSYLIEVENSIFDLVLSNEIHQVL